MFFRLKWIAALILLGALLFTSSVSAAYRPRVACEDSGEESIVTINSRLAVRFKVRNGSMPPSRRAQITSERINQMVGTGFDPRNISVKIERRQARVYAGPTFICVATKADAKANHTTPAALASSWVSSIRTLLLMPAVTLSDKSLLIPLGENRSVTVGGAARGEITLASADQLTAVGLADNNTRVVTVTGQKVGTTNIDISVEDEHITLNVTVKKYAGRLNLSTSQVTGNPCTSDILCYAAREAVKRSVAPEPGAIVSIGRVDCRGGALAIGETRRIEVDVTMTGSDYITFNGKSQVDISNVAMPHEEVKQLFYSNDPENFKKYQVLFAGMIEKDKASRLLFHHQNGMGKRAHFLVDLINSGSEPATYRIFRGISDPLVDTVLVGYKACFQFLKDYAGEVSMIETVPPHSRLVLVSDILANDITTSGIMEIRQISGEASYLRVTTLPPGMDNVLAGDIASAPNPVVLNISEHIYPIPVKSLVEEYTIGQRWAFIPIGKHAVTDATAQRRLYGNYGVTYTINVKVTNPTQQTKKVTVAFDPTAGLASGVFMIDGAFYATKYASPPDEVPLVSYQLQPGQTKNITVITIPVAGSNYPATLVVRS